jgi:predicted peptidase
MGEADATGEDTGSDTLETADTDTADGGPQGLPDGPAPDRHTRIPRVVGDANAPPNGYFEYLPPGDDRPLLVFWHGLGENGNGDSQLGKVLSNGPPKLIEADQWPSERSFAVLSPQHSGGGCPSADEIHTFIDYAVANYDVDTSRVYLTGLSCGAIGGWNYLGKYTDEQVAAAVLIAGDGRGAWNRTECDLGLVALWGFHGDADSTVSPQGTIVPMDNLEDCPSPPRKEVKQTIYDGVGHNSWARTYDLSAGHDVYTWLMQFSTP